MFNLFWKNQSYKFLAFIAPVFIALIITALMRDNISYGNIIASFSVLNLIPHDEEQGETYCITGPGPQEDLMRLLREMKKNDLIF